MVYFHHITMYRPFRTALLIILLSVFGLSCMAHAQRQTIPPANPPAQTIPPADCAPNCPPPTNTTTEFPLQVKLQNPLGTKAKDIKDVINLFMDAIIKIAIPFIVVFFIWSGINFILAQGNSEKLKKAKKMFWNTVIGTLLILGAWAITDAIVGTINSIAS